ncbi:hypothetical protein [Bradyrhizobium brasilense]|uniref:Uncharacterized protein n=1 Tax=Bradyrhizobium brasilense TaxID=1419277 RepID=A0ABY8JA85_9BRAD|nr:hypothetical protein [Bradyrhizobium brasilense]WFU62485.1 hypothetical protein QA636_34130 [Bradyrhizobium brasilense]
MSGSKQVAVIREGQPRNGSMHQFNSFAGKREDCHQSVTRIFMCSNGAAQHVILVTLLATLHPTGRPKAAESEIAIPERIAKRKGATIAQAQAADPSRAFNLFDSDCQGISLRIGAAIYYSCSAWLPALSLGPGVPEKERNM